MESRKISESEVSIIRSKPEGLLGMLVESYVFRRIQLKDGLSIRKYMPCRHTNSIDFYLGENFETIHLPSGKSVPFARSTIRGPRTYKKFQIHISNNFLCFSIRFKPAGIYQLFGIPMHHFRDEAIDAELIHPTFFRELTEKLMICDTIHEAIAITEVYFLNLLKKKKYQISTASRLADIIVNSGNSYPLSIHYNRLPLTTRQLERNFNKEIGVSPKTYDCMVRFENLLFRHMKMPERKWTDLAYESSYFDQMHLVKDFHKFLGLNPGNFSPQDFAF